MSLITIKNLSQSFGAFDVFTGLTARMEADARVGLVGPNGIGKTSLLLILAGLAEARGGSAHVTPGVRVGYLRQEAMDAFSQQENTVYAEMLAVFDGLQTMEARLRALEHAMSAGDTSGAVMDEYGALQEAFEQRGGYDYETRIEQTLTGLGFQRDQWTLPLKHLSGGQKTRALLARLLLEQPELLILDEPTNHLDVAALEWLETRLRAWKGALLVVSHDRYFLNAVVNAIWELSRTGIEAFRGNYDAYLRQRQERWEYAEKVYAQEMERLARELDYIKRNIARASTNKQAVGRLRRLSRDLYAIEHMGLMDYMAAKKWSDTGLGNIRPLTVMEAEQSLKAIRSPNIRPPRLNLNLKTTYRGGDIVLRAAQLRIGYPGADLFTADELLLQRGECAALIGGNGTGKTTFLRAIMGEIRPLRGEIRRGAGLKIGYFAQAHDALNPEHSVLDELIRHRHMTFSQARNVLGQYLFRGDDVFKKVGDLSGGERAKLAMAILSQQGANFLLLDEPSNHLDIAAQEILQETLESFEGTILLVTHDRYLVDRLATQIWTLDGGRLRVFQGTYQEYMAARQAQKSAAKPALPAKTLPAAARTNGDFGLLEERIAALEAEITAIGDGLAQASAARNLPEVERLSVDYMTRQQRLEQLMDEWTAQE